MCLITPDPGLFSFINQGALTVDGIDDVEEMQLCDVSSENGLSTPPIKLRVNFRSIVCTYISKSIAVIIIV